MNIVEVKNLVKKYDNFTAVDNITFSVTSGKVFAFLGPNGAGKTTTIKILTTLLHPTSGQVLVNGYDPLKNQHDVRSSFGIVFQDPSLDDELTARENMEFHGVLYHVSPSLRKERIDYLLHFVELFERKDDLVKHFSGGMKRRLEIARALVHHPRILFLDEPTVGLDPQTRNHLWNYIHDLNKNENMTVFLTTHYMDEAEKIADQIALIDKGKIIKQGTLDSFKKETKTASLEEAFLSLTGHSIREEEGTAADRMRTAKKVWGR